MPPAFVVALLFTLPPLVSITTIAVNTTALCDWLSGRKAAEQRTRDAAATVIQRAYRMRRSARLALGRVVLEVQTEQY